MSARTPHTNPAARAKKHVDDWFDAFVTSSDLDSDADMHDSAFTDVAEAVEQRLEQSGKPNNDDERRGNQLLAEREAGYLIGVQVGLRLRGAR